MDIEFARAVFLGGMVVALDLYYIDWSIQKKSKDENGKYKKTFTLDKKFVIEGTVKTIVIFGIIFTLLFYYKINMIAFLVGLSSLFISALIGLVF